MQREKTIEEIKLLLDQADAKEFTALALSLKADTRKGVISALETRRKQLQREQAETERVAKLYSFDASFNGACVVGLDEVGRGAVAGPLMVGAVILNAQPHIPLLNDSKQLTPEQRTRTAELIRKHACAYTTYAVPPEDIDEYGMAASLRRAFAGALKQIEQLGFTPDVVLLDGNPLHFDSRETNVVKGDAKSASIAAASIVAKVTRDSYMVSLDSTYPQYGFSSHKGYGSQEHIHAIETYGLSDVHRKTFCRSFNQLSLF